MLIRHVGMWESRPRLSGSEAPPQRHDGRPCSFFVKSTISLSCNPARRFYYLRRSLPPSPKLGHDFILKSGSLGIPRRHTNRRSPERNPAMSIKMLTTFPDPRKSVIMKPDPTRIDPLKLKLGKQPARHDPRTLLFATYATAALPAPPPSLDLTAKVKVPWGMMDNAQVGDCTCAAAGHLIMEWTANAQSKTVTPTDAQIIAAYSAITGYNPKTGSQRQRRTGNRCPELLAANWNRRPQDSGLHGSRLQPHPHHGWNLDLRRLLHRASPAQERAQAQTSNKQIWSVPPSGTGGDGAPGSWGGHAVPVVAYDSRSLTVVTWGALQTMTWGFWQAYCDEAYAILSPDFLAQKKGQPVTPDGFDVQLLLEDLSDLK